MKKIIITLNILIILLTSCHNIKNNDKCLSSIDDYRFEYNDNIKSKEYPDWDLLNVFDEENVENYKVEFVREFESQTEVWISYITNKSAKFFIFFPKTGNIDEISGAIKNTKYYIQKLLLTAENKIYGVTNWQKNDEDILDEYIYSLSLFNEITKHFYFVDSSYQTEIKMGYQKISNTMIAGNNILLLTKTNSSEKTVNEITEIYLFDTMNNNLEKINNIENVSLSYAHYANDKLFMINSREFYYNYYFGEGGPQEIIIYNLFSNEIEKSIKLPWDDYFVKGLLFDENQTLWLDSIIKIIDNNIEIIHPDIEYQLAQMNKQHFQLYIPVPIPLFQSSNGHIWYVEDTGIDNFGGVAWFDPDSEERCWVTNIKGYPVEGPNQIIWMMIENRLYSYDLKEK